MPAGCLSSQTLKAKPGQHIKHVLSVVDADHFLADEPSEIRKFLAVSSCIAFCVLSTLSQCHVPLFKRDLLPALWHTQMLNSTIEALCEASSLTEVKVVFTNCKWHGLLGEALVDLPLGKAKRLSSTSLGSGGAATLRASSSTGDAHPQNSETRDAQESTKNVPVKAILFDADGTLLDSLPPHVDFCHVSACCSVVMVTVTYVLTTYKNAKRTLCWIISSFYH